MVENNLRTNLDGHEAALAKVQTKPLFITSVYVNDVKLSPLSNSIFESILKPVLSQPFQNLRSTLSALGTIEKKLMYTGLYDDVNITLDQDKSQYISDYLEEVAPKEYGLELPVPIKAQIQLVPAFYQPLSLVTTTRDSYAAAGIHLSSLNKFQQAETIILQGELNCTPFSGKIDEKLLSLKCLVPLQKLPSMKAVFDINYALVDLFKQSWLPESDQHKQNQIGFNIGIQEQQISSSKFRGPIIYSGISILGRNLLDLKKTEVSSSINSWVESSKVSYVFQILQNNKKFLGTLPISGWKFNLFNEAVLGQTVAGEKQESGFGKVAFSYEGYSSFLRNHIITSLDLSFGTIFRYKSGSELKVHIMDQFYLGGLSSLKGFQRNSVGTRGGNSFYKVAFKSSFHIPGTPLASPLRLQAFVNAGDVFNSERGIPEDLATATGISLVYQSHLASLDLTYALPLSLRAQDVAKPGFSFGVSIAYM
ncbi:uncharacterized protein Ecym_4760 [Eremothecium cymbalariae DBVPG|uniref:Bacterial surface antigen (D15) domain-containing protein n=1 Tax=Eremothecium cymbalariae (strain CBS 270.75 / DBVPG 7215 / KCTC 17166 / NRRL Y-17582) TaxID=931890 RepID=G8JSQ0_ERECY|nr:hypothetical protein Ecym_4760 [Eremothecium cymbalariae DBVPG\